MKIKLRILIQLAIMLVVIFQLSSCKKDSSTTTPPTPVIGDSFQGGKIAYILVSGDPGYSASVQHGLIAAPSDTSYQWNGTTPIATGATATALGTGNANTNTIVSIQGAATYAAKYCSDLVIGSYSDWYLPSKDEMNKIYLNKAKIGGLVGDFYWTSSETDANNAWGQSITDGHQGIANKSLSYSIRAIRSF